jgi:hypothetical protein
MVGILIARVEVIGNSNTEPSAVWLQSLANQAMILRQAQQTVFSNKLD